VAEDKERLLASSRKKKRHGRVTGPPRRRKPEKIERLSKSQVSRLAKTLDKLVEDFRTRPLARASYPYLMLDALELKCRDGGRIVNVCVVHGVAVNRDGYRADESARFRACAAGQVLRFVEPVKVRIRYRRPFLSGAAARLAGLDRRRNSSVPFTLEQLPLLTRGLAP